MKTIIHRCMIFFSAVMMMNLMIVISAQNAVSASVSALSLKKELARSIDKGSDFLMKTQTEIGAWSDEDYPAITSLVLVALQGDPEEHHTEKKTAVLKKGYTYILSNVQPDGGIYNIASLMNYNTSVSILALIISNDPKYNSVIKNARRYVISGQQDFGKKGVLDTPLDGGIGYGDRYEHSDLSNTLFAIEALYYSKHLIEDDASSMDKLDWKAAIQFVQNCQNLPETNRQTWVSGDDINRGGFIYFPGESKAGEMKLNGRIALRSYGSISYVGMLSYIYAEMDSDDIRVKAVRDWLSYNYTLDENPGMGKQGLFFYYYTMSKALYISGIRTLKTRDDKSVNWARDLALKMLELQRDDGSWQNDNSRWWERDSALVTAYALLTIQNVYRSL